MQLTSFVLSVLIHIMYAYKSNRGSNSQQWRVDFTHTHICAVTGSSVVMPCSFSYPATFAITRVYWMIDQKAMADIKELPDYKGRVQYFWNGNKNCTLKLSKLIMSDDRYYYARIETNNQKQRFTSTSKVTLSVKELSVVIPEPVMEGTTVKLVCNNTCSSTDKVVWRKNGQDVKTNNIELILRNVRTDDAGNYSCVIKPFAEHPSRSVEINVMFPPRTPSISVSPADQTLEGAKVALTCSSDANPPVENYTWYYHKGLIASKLDIGKNYNIGKLSCEHIGYYYCKAENKHGATNSSDLYLDAHYAPRNISASLNQSGDLLQGSSVTLTCSGDANPPVKNYTWYRRTGAETVYVGTGEIITFNLTSVSTGLYHCEAQNGVGSENSTGVEVIWSGFGWQMTHLLLSFCSLTLFTLLIGLVFWRRKKAKQSNISRSSEDSMHGVPSNVHDSVARFTSDPAQRVDSADANNVQYASVQFKSSRVQQVAPPSTAQKLKPSKPNTQQQQLQQEEEVEYAAVHFSTHSAATKAKKTKPSNDSRSSNNNTQGVPSDVQDYVPCLTFDPALCVNSGDPDDVQYSSLQFKSSTTEEVPLYSTVQNPKLSKQHQEATEYAAVNVSKLTAVTQRDGDPVIYSTMDKSIH